MAEQNKIQRGFRKRNEIKLPDGIRAEGWDEARDSGGCEKLVCLYLRYAKFQGRISGKI
jgi:hypothetical protein